MRKIKLLVFFALISHISCTQNSKINGVSFVGGRNVVTETNIKPVLNVNANWACLMPFGFMRELNATEISFNQERQWWGERKIGVKETARLFHEKGVKIMIKPQIWVWHGEFTGTINMSSEEDWATFEKSYEKFILEYAALAAEANVELFCIGTELHTFVSKRSDFWSELIMKVKKVYKGELTYAENWDTFSKVPFWDQLNYIGVDAYFPLSKSVTPTVEELQVEWDRHKEKILTLQKEKNIPVLFTEYGYRSVDYATKEPWNFSRENTGVNLSVQENALQALYNTFWEEEWFAGGFLWKWFDFHDKAGGEENTRFTPQNKPAEDLIREFYGTQQ